MWIVYIIIVTLGQRRVLRHVQNDCTDIILLNGRHGITGTCAYNTCIYNIYYVLGGFRKVIETGIEWKIFPSS